MEADEGLKEISADKSAEDIAAVIIGKLNDAGDMEFGYSEFIVICPDYDEKEDDYLGFYRVDQKAGVFAQDISDDIRSGLTSSEASILSEHPLKDLNKPILPFPFTAAQLKAFMQWSANRGIEIPVDVEALNETIAKNQQKEAWASVLRQGARQNTTANESDASLGAHYRKHNQDLAKKLREDQEARKVEYQRWRDTAEEIQRGRQKPASVRQLARLVKERLNLPDAEDTIRKRL